ncbi:hypothetical protein vseg_012409 [Gypsophila vaccaria]
MATRSIINGVSITEINSRCYYYYYSSPLPLFLSSTHSSPSFSLSSLQLSSSHNTPHILRVSSDGLPNELEEGSKFVPLNEEDPSYGPPAILLLGFGVEEADKIGQLLKDLEGDFLQVIFCTEDMISRPLWDAVSSKQQSLKNLKIAKSVPRLCFLSGLTGEEMLMFIDAFEETDLEPAVFAAHVPNSSNKLLLEVIEEVIGDHESMAGNSEKP